MRTRSLAACTCEVHSGCGGWCTMLLPASSSSGSWSHRARGLERVQLGNQSAGGGGAAGGGGDSGAALLQGGQQGAGAGQASSRGGGGFRRSGGACRGPGEEGQGWGCSVEAAGANPKLQSLGEEGKGQCCAWTCHTGVQVRVLAYNQMRAHEPAGGGSEERRRLTGQQHGGEEEQQAGHHWRRQVVSKDRSTAGRGGAWWRGWDAA